jgi:hypothetical protein
VTGLPATFNAGPTVHQGIEAGLDWRIAPQWRLRQTYAFSDFFFDGDKVYGDNDLPVVPPHLYRAELRYDHPAGWFVAPTVYSGVTPDMTIAREEIFGPVLSVLKFSDMEELVRRANATAFGLAAAVWTRDIARAHDVARRLRAGTVWVNCYDVFDAAAPFGGFKQSGFGRELGERGLDPYLETKTVTVSLDPPRG